MGEYYCEEKEEGVNSELREYRRERKKKFNKRVKIKKEKEKGGRKAAEALVA